MPFAPLVSYGAPMVSQGFTEDAQGQRHPMTWVYTHTCGALVYEAFGWWAEPEPQAYCTRHNAFLFPTPTEFPPVLGESPRRLVDADVLIFGRPR